MASLISLALVGLLIHVVYRIVRLALRLRANIRAAKASGLPYAVAPVHHISRPWLATHSLLMPYLRRLPTWMTASWIDVVAGDWFWDAQYSAFEQMGSDTFLVASPWGICIYSADADVISQVTTRRNDFPKPISIYKAVDIYGKNVVTLEGSEWRRHRKITSPPFTERNNHLVWSESLFQAQTMLTSWFGRDGEKDGRAPNPMKDTMRLSLHVISRAGFNVRCLWPGINDDDEDAIRDGAMSMKTIPSGHDLSYVDSMDSLLHLIGAVIVFPDWLLKNAPFKPLNLALKAKIEWGRYMREMFESKRIALNKAAASGSDSGLDLMGAMIKGSGMTAQANGSQMSTKPTAKSSPLAGLTDSEIMGNSFVFMLAGHETAANTLHFAMVYLALNPSMQRTLQKELEQIFEGRSVKDWDYEHDLPQLFGGMTGAIMNETLRLVPPVLSIPKCVTADQDQPLTVNGRECIMPKDAFFSITASCVHRNPKYWPHGPARKSGPFHPLSNRDNDLEEFKPERWLLDSNKSNTSDGTTSASSDSEKESPAETGDLGVSTAPDTASSLFRPRRGAYVPFSEGYRACLGRRFAQVEILATLAVIFATHSVELDTSEWATEDELTRLCEDGRKAELHQLWTKASDRAEYLLREAMGTIITVQLRKGTIPLRFVEKGKEIFASAA